MIRQDVVINNYKYIVDVYKAETADLSENRYAEFVMLRNYEFSNNIVNDKDIYIIEKSLLDEYISNYNKSTDCIVFPQTNKEFTTFSTEYKDFNNNYSELTFLENKFDQYSLFKKDAIKKDENGEYYIDLNEKNCTKFPCDKVRIYHPHHKTFLKGIVYFDNYINNVHFHWYCRTLESVSENTYTDTPFTIDNIHYCEYIEFWMPSPEKIINKNVFYKENLNLVNVQYSNEQVQSNSEQIIYQVKYIDKDAVHNINIENGGHILMEHQKDKLSTESAEIINTYISTYIFTLPYKIEGDAKVFLPEYKQTVINNYISYPINITLFPYSEINSDNIYLADNELVQNSDTFYSEVNFSLSARMGFDENNTISVINTFNYPNKENFPNFKEAYQYYFDVNLLDYEGIVYIDEDDYNEDHPVEQKQCGFEIAIFKDYNKKYRIYKSYFEIEHPEQELDDFAFQMSNIFQNWEQLPEFLVCQTKFIDKYLGNVITSNQFLITKEWFKYMINDYGKPRIEFTDKQQKLNNISEMDLSKFNFIDKVNCVIKRESEDKGSINYNTKNTPRVIYRPIFFKTSELQNLQIKSGFVQNIGINLSEYMTKVDSFSLIIGDTINLIEYARNDVYVIFKLDSNLITNLTGQYHIANQDGEYISSGKYTVS